VAAKKKTGTRKKLKKAKKLQVVRPLNRPYEP
jgi:hypothetical protein